VTAKVIFFDAAGTLIEPHDPVGATYARVARDYGIDTDAAAMNASFRRVFGNASPLAFGPGRDAADLRAKEYRWWRELVAASFAGLGEFADFEAYFRQLFAFFADPANWRLDKETSPTLIKLHARGFRMGLISNFDHRLYRILAELGLSGYFETITISSEAGFAKPSPEIFRIALRKYGSAPGEAIHVGDSVEMDAAGALGAGLAAILLDPTAGSRCRLEGRMARISALDAVPEAIDQLELQLALQ
jgi:putative hydrolase of the HAD superfamily